MSYEIVPFAEEQSTGLSEFDLAIMRQIQLRGDQNVVPFDRYNPHNKPTIDQSKSIMQGGNVEYGYLWDVHEVDIEHSRLTYAYLPRLIFKDDLFPPGVTKEQAISSKAHSAKTEFFITEFGEHGAVSRTTFREVRDQNSRFNLIRQTRLGEGYGGVIGLNKTLDMKKSELLFSVVNNPEYNIIALNALLKLSKRDRAEIKKENYAHDKREKQYRERIEAVVRSTRRPMFS